MKKPDFATIAADYTAKFLAVIVHPRWDDQLHAVVEKIRAGRGRYENVANRMVNPPWFVIAIIHQLECGGDFSAHLHNGDPLTHRTVNEPAGRPRSGQPPFRWEDSAWDAVRCDGLDQWKDWTIPGFAYELEGYNGWGYRAHNIPSPYLWSGSQHYVRGKFIRDGVFDTTAVSHQLGALVILRELCRLGDVPLRASHA